MSYILRDYQTEAARVALANFHLRRPFVIQMATGAGKSLVIADICHKLNEHVLILQPSKELLEQNHAKLVSYGTEDIGIYSASKSKKEIAKYTYATIGSIYKRPELFQHFKHVIIDECHLVNPRQLDSMYKSFLDAIGCRNVCGLTATPYRIQQKYVRYNEELYYTATLKVINRMWDNKARSTFWKEIPYKMETDELIAQGYLAPIRYFTDKIVLDSLKLNTTGSDFTEKSLGEWAMTKVDRIEAAIQFVDSRVNRNLVFCTSIAQARKVAERLEKRGIKFGLVTGETPKKEREQLVAAFRSGEIRHMLNVGVFTTGFDVPELDCVILARPTMSLALYYQMVGRGVRIDPNNATKVLRVLDLAGVVERLGKVETIKLGKEDHQTYKGFQMDTVMSEVGRMDERPLFAFKITKKEKYHAV